MGVRAGWACVAAFAVLLAWEARADEEPEAIAAGAKIHANPANVNLYVPQRWGHMRLTLFNPHDNPAEFFCSTYFEEQPSLQYARRAWVPPHSLLQTVHPVFAPAVDDPNQQLLELKTLVLDSGGGGEALIGQAFGSLKVDSSFRIAKRGPVTALYDTVGIARLKSERMTAADFVLTARFEAVQGMNVVYLNDPFLPPGEEALDAVDQLVIADGRLAADAAGLAMVRRWLNGGGSVWVMLDRTGAPVLEALLGDEFACQVVDHIGLVNVIIESLLSHSDRLTSIDFDDPVDHVRVLVTDAEITHTVNGWPAAFRRPCGQGRLLVTTLGAEAWVRPRTEQYRSSRSIVPPTNFVTTSSLDQLATYIFAPKEAPPVPQQAAEAHVTEQVGYSVPPRTTVLGLLAAFSISLVGLAAVLIRQGRLEQLGVWGPAAALLTGGALVFAGHRSQGAVPATTAVLQLVQAIPGTDDVSITGTAAVYSSEAGLAETSGSRGGWILPNATGAEGTTRRIVWADEGRWQWENLPQSPGLRAASFRESRAVLPPLRAVATLDERGVVGRLDLPGSLRPADGVLATSSGRIGVHFADDGRFTADSSQVLSADQYIAADVLSDEQLRRSRTLAELLAPRKEGGFPPQPTLVFWTDRWETGLRFQSHSRETGSALVSVPITFARPASGTVITIPPPLLPYREGYGPDGIAPTGLFDARSGQWFPRYLPSTAWLEIRVPPELLPLEPRSLHLTVQVSGPVGKLDIAGFQDGKVIPIKTWIDPVGTLTFDVTDRGVLALSREGRLTLRVAAGDPDRPELTGHQSGDFEHKSYWQIESLKLELRAHVNGEPGA